MRTPWTHFGHLTDIEMACWIIAMITIGSVIAILVGGIAERIGARLRRLMGDRQRLPSYWQQFLRQ